MNISEDLRAILIGGAILGLIILFLIYYPVVALVLVLSTLFVEISWILGKGC